MQRPRTQAPQAHPQGRVILLFPLHALCPALQSTGTTSGISETPVILAHLVLLCFPSLAPTPSPSFSKPKEVSSWSGQGRVVEGQESGPLGFCLALFFPSVNKEVASWQCEDSCFCDLQGGPGSRHRMNLKHNDWLPCHLQLSFHRVPGTG